MDTLRFLPVSRDDMLDRDWYYYDFLLITGDAYVDHPSFGAAVIGRVLTAAGYRVAVLAQPSWRDTSDFEAMGRPRYAALVTAGNLDSMVAHYTAAKKPRSEDFYSPGKRPGQRPNRAVIVYSNLVRAAFAGLPVIIGGIEASLRRFSHYDYWDNKVRRSVLFDSKADIIVFGMGEMAITELANRFAHGEEMKNIIDVRGTGFVSGSGDNCAYESVICPSHEDVSNDKRAYSAATKIQYDEYDPVRGRAVIQHCGGRALIINPPSRIMRRSQLDGIYALAYTREAHPMYKEKGGVPALNEVRFSITHNRGCFGGCSFCALAFHQGRTVVSRSHASVLKEAQALTGFPDFKGYIHDVGGPTANFRHPSCDKQLERGMCADRNCLVPEPCANLNTDHKDYMLLLTKLSAVQGVKKVFVRSGIRYDYLMLDKNGEFFNRLVKSHISGQLKIAPEHCSDNVLSAMNKPTVAVYNRFIEKYGFLNKKYCKKQFLVPYFMSSHPGSTIKDAVVLAEYMRNTGQHPEQVQDFYPTPGTLSTSMYYTGLDPRTRLRVYVPRSVHERAMQRALLQWKKRENHALCREALRAVNRNDLIGSAKQCLVPKGI